MLNQPPGDKGVTNDAEEYTQVFSNRVTRIVRHLRGLLLVTHPLPSAMYVVMTAILAWLAAATIHTRPSATPLALMLLAVAGSQVAIGSVNDYCDRELDAAGHRQEKPLVSGLIAPWEAIVLAVAASMVVVIAIVALGPVAFVLGLLIEGLGLAYDLRFKGTPVSAVLFALYFPLFPLLAWAVFGHWQPFLLWLVPMGAALGIAMNISNTLPDMETDRAAGMRGLPHLLGLRFGIVLAWSIPLLTLSAMWLLNLTSLVPARSAGLIIATAGGILAALLPPVLYLRQPSPRTLRLTFLLQGLGVLALAGGWIAAAAFYPLAIHPHSPLTLPRIHARDSSRFNAVAYATTSRRACPAH
jgi:4-hydroxybenzoate polyprenyltransferase